MPAGRWGSGDGRDDGSAGEWWDATGDHPDGHPFSAEEELEHELALAAALDRSRTDLSPDEATAERMRLDFFAKLDEKWGAPPETDTERTTRIAPIPPAALPPIPATASRPGPAAGSTEQTADLTAALRPDATEGATRSGAAGERVLAGPGSGSSGNRTSRRARHVLPSDHPDNRRPGRRAGLRRRVALVGGAAALALVALAGGTAMMSRSALPGDALYGVKLAAESTGTAFTFGDAAKAQRHLDTAATRLQEVGDLRKAGRTPDPEVYQTALKAFDEAASEGSRLMLAGAEPPTDTGLGDLDTWAHTQSQVIESLQDGGAAVPGAEQSAKLMQRLSERAAALQARMGCAEVSGGVDDLGPVPATGPCTPVSAAGGSGSSSALDRSTPQSARTGASTAPSTAGSTDPSAPATTDGNGLPLAGIVPGTEAGTSTTPAQDAQGSGTSSSSPQSTSSDKDTKSGGGGSGLLPPINLPPLLPGLPPITLG